MIHQLVPDMKRIIELSKKLGEHLVEYKYACEIKRGRMPDKNRLRAMQELENEIRQELNSLKEKWGFK